MIARIETIVFGVLFLLFLIGSLAPPVENPCPLGKYLEMQPGGWNGAAYESRCV